MRPDHRRSESWTMHGPGRAGRWLSQLVQLGTPLLVYAFGCSRMRAADHFDYRFERYQEEHDRVAVNTHTALFEVDLTKAITARGELVYDSISGATPNGAPPRPGSDQVPLVHLSDERRAGNVGMDFRLGRQTLTPQVAYSKESDYQSTGLSLNDAIDFNEKNTTLRLGVSHNFDTVLDFDSPRQNRDKRTTEGMVGISQLLDSHTILTADFTYGYESGYLTDPYRQVLFQGWLTVIPGVPLYIVYPEVRPEERSKQVFQSTLTHAFEAVNGSAELLYRFHHDSYGVFSHTAALTWHQRIGDHLILEPIFRYYEQTAADFYHPEGVPGLSPIDGDPTRPEFYSADYRLSHFASLTYGLQVSFVINDKLYLDGGYHRYDMLGRDSVTSASAYPKANIFTVGLRLWF